MADITIQFPERDVATLFSQIQRAQTDLNKDTRKAISWAGSSLCTSLGASTKNAPERRKVFKATPSLMGAQMEKANKGEKQVIREGIAEAPYGVYIYKNGKPVFRQIKQISPRVIPFRSSSTGEWLGRHAGTGEVHKLHRWLREKTLLKDHPLVKIKYAGLAKLAWKIAKAKVVSGGYGFAMRIKKPIVEVEWVGSAFNSSVKIRDMLGYAMDAFRTDGKQAVNSAFKRASDSLEKRISDAVERNLEKAVS